MTSKKQGTRNRAFKRCTNCKASAIHITQISTHRTKVYGKMARAFARTVGPTQRPARTAGHQQSPGTVVNQDFCRNIPHSSDSSVFGVQALKRAFRAFPAFGPAAVPKSTPAKKAMPHPAKKAMPRCLGSGKKKHRPCLVVWNHDYRHLTGFNAVA